MAKITRTSHFNYTLSKDDSHGIGIPTKISVIGTNQSWSQRISNRKRKDAPVRTRKKAE